MFKILLMKSIFIASQALVVLSVVAATVAALLGFDLGASLLGKVNYQPAKYTHIQPEVTVQAPEYKKKSMPVPVPVPQRYYNNTAITKSALAVFESGTLKRKGNKYQIAIIKEQMMESFRE